MLGMNELATSTSTSSGGGFNLTALLPIVLIVAVVWLLFIRPQQRRRQQAQQQQNTTQPGARVVTTAGLYATVVAVDGDDVILEVAPGVEMRYMKRAIMNVVSPAESADEPEEGEAPADAIDEDEVPVGEASEDYPAQQPSDVTGQDGVAAEPEGAGAEETEAEETAYERATGTKKD